MMQSVPHISMSAHADTRTTRAIALGTKTALLSRLCSICMIRTGCRPVCLPHKRHGFAAAGVARQIVAVRRRFFLKEASFYVITCHSICRDFHAPGGEYSSARPRAQEGFRPGSQLRFQLQHGADTGGFDPKPVRQSVQLARTTDWRAACGCDRCAGLCNREHGCCRCGCRLKDRCDGLSGPLHLDLASRPPGNEPAACWVISYGGELPLQRGRCAAIGHPRRARSTAAPRMINEPARQR